MARSGRAAVEQPCIVIVVIVEGGKPPDTTAQARGQLRSRKEPSVRQSRHRPSESCSPHEER